MASGVGVSDECVTLFAELKKKQHRYLIMKVSDDNTEIVIEHTGARDDSYTDFTSKLPKESGRYGIFDYDYKMDDGSARDKIVFVLWAPDDAPIKAKMLYTSSKADFKKSLGEGIGCEVQGTDASEIDEQEVLEKVLKLSR